MQQITNLSKETMANTTILEYSFLPNEVFISTSVDIRMIIKNPQNGSLIKFKGGRDGDSIQVYFPLGKGATDLVENLDFKTRVPAGTTCEKSSFGDYYTLNFTNNTTKLQPGEQLEIIFLQVPVNSQYKDATPAVIKIEEGIGEYDGDAFINIAKKPNDTFEVIAWVSPSTIGLNQFATLYWQSVGGTKVVIGPFKDGDKTFKVDGPPPSPGNFKINIPSTTESQRTYTLTLYTSDQQHTAVPVTLTQNPPLITAFTSDKSGLISVDDAMVLDWFYLWGGSSAINSNSGLQLNNPRPEITVNPGKDLAQFYKGNYENMPSSIYYELYVNGFQTPAKRRVEIGLLPVKLLYFKYTSQDASGGLSGIDYQFDTPEWKGFKLDIEGNNLATLTLYQPGSTKEVYYLGADDTIHPQIQFFTYKSKGSGVYELSWITANLDELTLDPSGDDIPVAQIESGTKDVSLTASATFTLKGTAKNGSIITSQLHVII
ncbi:hypothetical protein M8998_01630 [Sphingobacterium sp. lm-10]|uniref:hypothetical protein n=1 Tax=Sphingobacterium sp. lm-10 TaxID=2944904 RepID=UPI0020216D2B|nr:hypothetical protein [Sphingobacterium sp. lm-10]MCL7986631.1 hypothetical protein [Sphingobacterium sp. lm-10]